MDAPASPSAPAPALRRFLAGARERLVAPSPRLVHLADRMRARLLASLLAVVVGAGLASGLVQLALVPGFLPTFQVMLAALAALAAGYGASRTRRYRAGAWVAALAPIAACAAVAVLNPDDRVWYAFMSLGVLLASVFLSLRATATVAALAFGVILLLAALVPELRAPQRIVPPLAFHAVFSPMLVLAAHHRNRLEDAERRLQLQLLEVEKLESVGRLAGGVAHDFNNLLTAMLGAADLLEEAVRSGQPTLEDVREIKRAGAQARDLTRQLLAVARRQPVEPRLVDLNGVLRDAERLVRGVLGVGVALELRPAAGLWLVRADPGQLQRVVLNLAANARDALPNGGRFALRTDDVELDGETAHRRPGLRPGPHVRLTAADDGAGMAPEVVARAFEPFFTTKPASAGTGLGLASVWGIVTQAGGHVGVESEPGRGARFEILLPRAGAGPG